MPVAGSAYTFSYATARRDRRLDHRLGPDPGVHRRRRGGRRSAGRATSPNVLDGHRASRSRAALASAADGFINLPAGLHRAGPHRRARLGIKLSSRVNPVAGRDQGRRRRCWSSSPALFFVKAANLHPVHPAERARQRHEAGCKPPLIQVLFGLGAVDLRLGRHLHRRGASCSSPSSGSTWSPPPPRRPEPAARPADRHLRLAGDLHAALRRGLRWCVTGMQNYTRDRPRRPRAAGDRLHQRSATTASPTSSRSAPPSGIIVVVMILLLGQSRVAFAMARDGLLPPVFAKVHPTFRHAVRHHDHHRRRRRPARRPRSPRSTCWPSWSTSARCSRSSWSAVGVVVLRRTRPDLPAGVPGAAGAAGADRCRPASAST